MLFLCRHDYMVYGCICYTCMVLVIVVVVVVVVVVVDDDDDSFA